MTSTTIIDRTAEVLNAHIGMTDGCLCGVIDYNEGRHQAEQLARAGLLSALHQPRPLPDREQIARAMEQTLVDFVGRCSCDEAYTTRQLTDPDCLWHNVNVRGEFPGDAADAVLKLFQDKP